jgi:hypothetical protein
VQNPTHVAQNAGLPGVSPTYKAAYSLYRQRKFIQPVIYISSRWIKNFEQFEFKPLEKNHCHPQMGTWKN